MWLKIPRPQSLLAPECWAKNKPSPFENKRFRELTALTVQKKRNMVTWISKNSLQTTIHLLDSIKVILERLSESDSLPVTVHHRDSPNTVFIFFGAKYLWEMAAPQLMFSYLKCIIPQEVWQQRNSRIRYT